MNGSSVFIRDPYNYNRDEASRDSGLFCEAESSMTQQSFKEECDINTIVRNFGLTGEMPSTLKTPMQGDFTEVTDFQSAMNLLLDAEAAFMQIPADVRAQFKNDPQEFLDFVSDPANLEKAKEMGFGAIERGRPEPIQVRVVADQPDPATAVPAAS